MSLSKSVLFASIATIVTACYGTASAASIVSCTISDYSNNVVLAQVSGQTSCAASVSQVPLPYQFRLESGATWFQTSSLSFGASARSMVANDCCGFLAHVESVAEGWTREEFYFTDAPIGSLLRIDWSLFPMGPDSSDHLFVFAGETQYGFHSQHRTEIPVEQGLPVIVEAYLRQGCYNNSYCNGGTQFFLNGLDLVDASGATLSGYRFRLGSGLTLPISEPDPVFVGGIFPGGIPDQPTSEPSTSLLIGAGLIIVGLAAKRKMGKNRDSGHS
jgi:hypothetical protein